MKGALHAGYPVMGPMGGESAYHLNLSKLMFAGSWSLGHEIGHNVQWMTGFHAQGYGETTNNFWSVFVNQNVSFS